MGGKSRRSRRSGTSEGGGREGGYHMWGRAPTHPTYLAAPHHRLSPRLLQPQRRLPPHTSLSSSKFRPRKSRAGVAPSLWCPDWHPAMSGICQKFDTFVKAPKFNKALSYGFRMCFLGFLCHGRLSCVSIFQLDDQLVKPCQDAHCPG